MNSVGETSPYLEGFSTNTLRTSTLRTSWRHVLHCERARGYEASAARPRFAALNCAGCNTDVLLTVSYLHSQRSHRVVDEGLVLVFGALSLSDASQPAGFNYVSITVYLTVSTSHQLRSLTFSPFARSCSDTASVWGVAHGLTGCEPPTSYRRLTTCPDPVGGCKWLPRGAATQYASEQDRSCSDTASMGLGFLNIRVYVYVVPWSEFPIITSYYLTSHIGGGLRMAAVLGGMQLSHRLSLHESGALHTGFTSF